MAGTPARARGHRRREAAARIALLLFGVCAGVALLEGILQAGALVVRATTRGAAATPSGARTRMVALGDSNTWGLWLLDREQAYPKVFERLWNATAGLPPLEVTNLAYPGTNSSMARKILQVALAELHPEFVTVMIGGNDWWTEVRDVQDLDPRARLSIWLWRHSRVYRLLFMLRRTWQTPVAITEAPGGTIEETRTVMRIGGEQLEVGFAHRDGATIVGDPFATLDPNLQGMVADARKAGARIVILTYPCNFNLYGRANEISRVAAHASGAPLVDVGEALATDCPPRTECPFLVPRDDHPTEAGHQRIARLLFDARPGW